MLKSRAKKSRQEINDASWELKRKRKHKGLPSGSRFNNSDSSQKSSTLKEAIDPRIGSKKPITLVATEKRAIKPIKKKLPIKSKIIERLPPEQELEKLENDPKLDHLLDLVEQNELLTDEQQQYLDSKLDRIDLLMKQLGYLDNEDSVDEDEKKEDIISLLKQK